MTGEETLNPGKRNPSEADEEEEVEELEREVREMAEKILDSRTTIPDRLMKAFSSHLIARRPVLSDHLILLASEPAGQAGTGGDLTSEMPGSFELSEEVPPPEADQGMLEKLRIFRAKTASNIAAMPVILNRMHECIARIDKLEQLNVNSHSVFKKKRLN